MTTLRSGARPEAPEMPSGQVRLQQPPKLQPHEGYGQALMMAIPMLGSVGAIVLVATMSTSGSGAPSTSRLFLTGGMFALAALGFVAVQIDRQRRQRQQQVTGSRTDYLHYLAGVRDVVRTAAEQQRAALTWRHPAPGALPSLAEERSRLWERLPGDDHFLHVRHGVAAQPLALDLVPPESTPVDQLDPTAASAVQRLLAVHSTQPDLPTALDLHSFERIEIVGDDDGIRAAARALLCSATAFHSPDHLVVAVLTAERNLPSWDWVKWLPHALSDRQHDAVGPRRLVSTSVTELGQLLPLELGERPRFGADDSPALPHVLLVLDGAPLPPGNHLVPTDGLHGLTVLDLQARWHEATGPADETTGLRLELGPAPAGGDTERRTATALRPRTEPTPCTVDLMPLATAEAFARRLAPLGERGSAADTGPTEFTDLLGLGDVTGFDPASAWRPRPARDRLRVPIGVTDTGAPVHLDLKESAQQGMGPHGLVIGATGSGKSEFLRTLVLGLAMTHDPTDLNMVLVDFKGGATFAGMAPLPHVSAVITNLADDLTLVDRMHDALSGEMVRRQELLRAAGNFASVRDYEKARLTGAALDPLPSLLIVVDEFSEMLASKPEFIDLFVAIGRLGRSLGLHLLLASQRLEEGRLRGLESHLSYRVGLRTFSAAESRAVLGVPDAYELPAVPGLGYLKPDQSTLVGFKAAYVSGPPAGQVRMRRDEGGNLRGILPFTIAEVTPLETTPEAVVPPAVTDDAESVLNLAVARMVGRGTPARRVWLPPLDRPAPLDAFFDDLVADPQLGLVSPKWRRAGALTVPLGIVDRPREQRRDVLTTSLAGAAGHVAVVGGPRTGKSTLLRTLVTSLALTTTPLETQFFVLDFGGGTFASLRDLPHLAGLGSRSEPEVVSRVVAEVQAIVDRREALFAAHGIDSVETYRARRDSGGLDDGYGDVFVVVDGWSTLRADFEELELELQALAQRGLTFGVHLVASASRWVDFRASLRDLFGTRLELRLGDALDSEVDRKVAELVPARAGRGLVSGPFHFLGALPRIDGVADDREIGEATADLAARAAAAWQGPAGPKLRLLPDVVPLPDLRELAPDDPRLLLGINERELAPVGFDVTRDSHLLVLGDGQSGKSSLLRGLVREITRTHTPEQAQIIAVDYRRSLLGEIPADYQLDYLTNAAQAMPAMKELADYLTNRLPGPDVTSEQLRNRSWWNGAEAWLLVDDYDLVATQAGSPLHTLVPLLAQARDVGFHVIVTRRTGGAARGLYDPLLQGIRDVAAPGLMLAGNPEEGPLLGNLRPQPAPPGRGRLVTRDSGVETVQLAWAEPQP